MSRKPVFVRALAALAVVVAVFAGSSTVQADEAGTLAGPCGSSYSHVGHHKITKSPYGTVGHLDVYWSSSTKRNCLVVNGYGAAYGYKDLKVAWLWDDRGVGSPVAYDSGQYSYYAGPVYTPRGKDMTGKCISIQGRIDLPNGTWVARRMERVHCG
ncbi:hypothetical protein [Salininema proteolyticum]|uniref:Spore-associated protein A n=1 Tax=Salininema proteolyticum TaxID=1607685 RepID=A0ABV8TUB4_9ACTN